MSIGENEKGGIHARRMEAENVVSGMQIPKGRCALCCCTHANQIAHHLFGGYYERGVHAV